MHFTVMVIGNNPEVQLAKFDENERNSWVDEHDEVINTYMDKELNLSGDDATNAINSGIVLNMEAVKEFAKDYFGYEMKDGRFGYYTNKDGHWDWYTLGGRWMGSLKIKNYTNSTEMHPVGMTYAELNNLRQIYLHKKETYERIIKKYKGKEIALRKVIESNEPISDTKYPEYIIGEAGTGGNKCPYGYADAMAKKDIDWEGMRADTLQNRKDLYKQMKKKPDNFTLAWSFGISLEEFETMTEEAFLARCNPNFKTHSVILNGEWIDDVSEEQYLSILESINENDWIWIYDCHA